eukprot:NODE_478_length_2199_cov_114.236279_g440_i0.p1 GENE.NODE_478_length_2199_cov_114.236279_g440_i0~~NODE_478_length_2199_cov_114.236279_g440_i0.p1  ORF type:complete len:305 (-),score=45.76 NODE_478_length_2199_cov_114.236279_g440_i0:1198-2112(-)
MATLCSRLSIPLDHLDPVGGQGFQWGARSVSRWRPDVLTSGTACWASVSANIGSEMPPQDQERDGKQHVQQQGSPPLVVGILRGISAETDPAMWFSESHDDKGLDIAGLRIMLQAACGVPSVLDDAHRVEKEDSCWSTTPASAGSDAFWRGASQLEIARESPHASVSSVEPGDTRGAASDRRTSSDVAVAVDSPQKAIVNVQQYKTQMCRNWRRRGECRYASTCCFAHGHHELRRAECNAQLLTSIGITGAAASGRFTEDDQRVRASLRTILRSNQKKQRRRRCAEGADTARDAPPSPMPFPAR